MKRIWRKRLLWWIGITVIGLGFLSIWAISGGLWEPLPRSIDFRLVNNDIPKAHDGAAERYRERLYGGTDVPGWTETTELVVSASGDPPAWLVSQARARLAGRLGVPLENITLQRSDFRVFFDDRLGCAAPGEINVGANIRGWVLMLRNAGEEIGYQYNVSNDGKTVVFCGRGV